MNNILKSNFLYSFKKKIINYSYNYNDILSIKLIDKSD